VRLYSATTEKERIHFHRIHEPSGERVRYPNVRRAQGASRRGAEAAQEKLPDLTLRPGLPRLLGEGDERRRRLEKSADQIEKGVEPVMVDPMAGVFERDDLGVAEMAGPPVVRRVGGPALLAVDEEGRAIDALP
jgi:hypothetical protein